MIMGFAHEYIYQDCEYTISSLASSCIQDYLSSPKLICEVVQAMLTGF